MFKNQLCHLFWSYRPLVKVLTNLAFQLEHLIIPKEIAIIGLYSTDAKVLPKSEGRMLNKDFDY